MFKDSFYDIAVGLTANAGVRASAQKTLIDSLTETSPILSSIPVEKANRSNANIFERLVSTDVVGIVDLDAPLPEMNSQGQLDHVNLSKFGGKVIIPCDKATELGGRDAYLGQKLPPIMRASCNSAERSIYYNNMLAAAIKYKNVQSATASPSGNNYCSIVAVTWTTGETTGLLSPLPYEVGTDNAGLLFNTKWYNGGSVYEHPVTRQNVWGAYVEGKLGVQLANERSVAAIVNIGKNFDMDDLTLKISEMLLKCRANARTTIYMSAALWPALITKFGKVRESNVLVGVTPTGGLSLLGYPAITSYNLKGWTEGPITV